jgi:hypothetical protein
MPGLDRGEGLGRHLILRVEHKVDPLAGPPLERGDEFADHLVLLGEEAFLPPDDEVGGPGAERRQRERGGEEDGPDPHGATP